MPKKIKIFKKLLAIAILCGLSACGLQVVYKDQNLSTSLSHELAGIRIKKDRTELSQQLRNNLYDILNPDHIKASGKYFLILKLNQSSSPTFITTTGASGRNKITLNVNYELRNAENMQQITKGIVEMSDNYDVSLNRFGTYVSQNYVENNLTKLIAQNIRNSLVNDLVELQKRCDNLKDSKEEDSVCYFIND
jgi:hypothetical protein